MYDKEIFYLVEKLKPLFRDFVGNGDVWTHLFRILLVQWTYIFSRIFYSKISKSAFISVIHATFCQKPAENYSKQEGTVISSLSLMAFGLTAGGLELTTTRIGNGRYASTATADL